MQRTHWLDWREGNRSGLVNLSPIWYTIPLWRQVLTGALKPAGVRCSSVNENKKNSDAEAERLIVYTCLKLQLLSQMTSTGTRVGVLSPPQTFNHHQNIIYTVQIVLMICLQKTL